LPKEYVICKTYKEVISAIKDLTVRGAPAIGVAAAMGAALGALNLPSLPPKEFRRKLFVICDEISQARPTARNLFWALERMKKCLDQTKHVSQSNLVKELIIEAKRICSEDIDNKPPDGKIRPACFLPMAIIS